MQLNPGVVIPKPDPGERMSTAMVMAGDLSQILCKVPPKELPLEELAMVIAARLRVMNYKELPVETRAATIAVRISDLLYSPPPEGVAMEWATPIVLKLLLLWMGDELHWLVSCATATPRTIEGLTPPADAQERIDRLRTSLRTPWITAAPLTDEELKQAKEMLAILEASSP